MSSKLLIATTLFLGSVSALAQEQPRLSASEKAIVRQVLGADINNDPVILGIEELAAPNAVVIIAGELLKTPIRQEEACEIGNDGGTGHKRFQIMISKSSGKIFSQEVGYIHLGGCE